MAKKGNPKKTAQKKKPTTTKAKPPRKPGPRSQALPGMEQVRYVSLDNLCESIAENRREINARKSDDAGLQQQALKDMRTRDVTIYRHAGVELVRVSGEERLTVRTTKIAATADADPAEVHDAGEDQD